MQRSSVVDNMTRLILICFTALAATIMAEEVDEVQVARLLHNANNKFSARMFNEVAKANEGKSFVLSAFSVMPPLGQLALASVGESHDELLRNLDIPNDNMTVAVFSYSNALLQSVEDVTLKMAGKIFIGKDYKINKNFGDVSRSAFQSEVQNIDFDKKQEAAHEINQWVEAQTNNKIKDLVDPNSISSATRAILANAIYFQGNWKDQFSKYATQERDFHVSKDKTNKVQMMNRKGYYNYVESNDLNAQVLEIPYKGDQLSLVVVLPREIDGLHAVEEKLKDPSALDKALEAMSNVEVDVFLPRFKIETKTELKDVLVKMGIEKLFSPGKARLDNLLEGQNDLSVDSAVQKAFIEVNEEGTEAAAANAFEIVGYSLAIEEKPAPVFMADKPFYFLIKDKIQPLFNGVMHGE